MNPLDPIEFCRRRPDMFFTAGKFNIPEMVGTLLTEILVLDRDPDVKVYTSLDGFVFVEAARDWIGEDLRVFEQLAPFPEAGANSVRAEILVNAFCGAWGTSLGDQVQIVHGLEPRGLETDLKDTWPSRRMLWFKAPEV